VRVLSRLRITGIMAFAVLVILVASPAPCAIDVRGAGSGESESGSPTDMPSGVSIPTQEVPRPPSASLEGKVDPEEYMLGVGDVLSVGFWGEVNRQEQVTVTPDGVILVPPVGPIDVDGLTLAEARVLLVEKLSPYYRPSILSVSLLRIRSFRVHVVGQVSFPGAYEVNSITRVHQAITLAGGFVEGSSMRNVQVYRDDDTVRVDLTRYVLVGDSDANPFLLEGDVVYIPPRVGSVYIFGSLYRPGNYEFIEGETLSGLIELAGGFRPEADADTLRLSRFPENDPWRPRQIEITDVGDVRDTLLMRLDDRVFVRARPEWHEDAVVEIIGEVIYPGKYVVEEGEERLTSLIERAGGFTEEASLAEALLVRNAYAERELVVESELMTIGEVSTSFDHTEMDMFKTFGREPKGLVSISLVGMLTGESDFLDPALYDGDRIEIPKVGSFVRVAGQVVSPGLIDIAEDERATYYIKKAGGYTSRADKGKTRVIRGTAGQRFEATWATILPGDIIWVPEKRERDWWQNFKDVVTIAAQLATVYLVIREVARN